MKERLTRINWLSLKGFIYLITGLLTLSLCGCCHEGDDHGLALSLLMPGEDSAGEIHTWIYKEDGTLVKENTFATPQEFASTLTDLVAGKYEIIVANNLKTPFSTSQTTIESMKGYEGLVFSLDDASASPSHAHYGVQEVNIINENVITGAEVKMNRILAEIQLTLIDVPEQVTSVEATITNVAKGFIPFSGKLLSSIDMAKLGTVVPVNGIVSFPARRVMPVVSTTSTAVVGSRAESDIFTEITIVFHLIDGSTVETYVKAPKIDNGGSYIPKFSFDILKPGIAVTVSAINGWKEGPITEGEILNPYNN